MSASSSKDVKGKKPAPAKLAPHNAGRHLNTKVADLVRFLKDSQELHRLDDLAIKTGIEELLSNQELFNIFKNHERVAHETKTNLWRYKPDHDIRTKNDLLGVLKNNSPNGGMQVKTLKEAWPQAIAALEELEKQGKVLLVRTKDDDREGGQLKAAFYDSVGQVERVDKEFRDLWHGLNTPDEVDLPRELEAEGLRATQQEQVASQAGPVKKKKRTANRKVKITNTHLEGIDLTKDYVAPKKTG